jgi:hypothetical protein
LKEKQYIARDWNLAEVWIKGCNPQFRSGLGEFAFLIHLIHRHIKHQARGPFLATIYDGTKGNQYDRKILPI